MVSMTAVRASAFRIVEGGPKLIRLLSTNKIKAQSLSTAPALHFNGDDNASGTARRHRTGVVPPTASFARVQEGFGNLVATAQSSNNRTNLTTVSHKAPARLIPVKSSNVSTAGAAVVALSNYGGGLLPGDLVDYNVQCDSGAVLGLVTQGSNRIYRQKKKTIMPVPSIANLNVRIGANALVVVAPDPVAVFQDSIYHQTQSLHCHETASVVSIDWISAGRYTNGERWQQTSLNTTTELYLYGDDNSGTSVPVLVDSLDLTRSDTTSKNAWGMDWGDGDVQFNAFCSMVVYGDQVKDVVGRCYQFQNEFTSCHTRTRVQKDTTDTEANAIIRSLHQKQLSVGGRVIVGVSQVPINHHDNNCHLIRFAATSNEDIYRVLYHCLEPLSIRFGASFYKDRIRAVRSGPVYKANTATTTSKSNGEVIAASTLIDAEVPSIRHELDQKDSHDLPWAALILADSALPTGAFAHSSGLEAASQLGLLQSTKDVATFVNTATQSNLQMVAPFLRACHSELSKEEGSQDLDWYLELDRYCGARLASNEPAHRASLDQGRSLLRVALKWMETGSSEQGTVDPSHKHKMIFLQNLNQTFGPNQGHLSTVLGVVTQACNLTEVQACNLVGYCVARDIVSAAVRLNLIGPLASVGMLDQAQQAAQEGIRISLARYEDYIQSSEQMEQTDRSIKAASIAATGCAPIHDAIQPCHDILATRLFRT